MRLTALLEMAPPSFTVQRRIYWHGTQGDKKGRSILSHGISPRKASTNRSFHGALASMQGYAYLTPDLELALEHAIGGYGSVKGYIGWVFAVNGSDLIDVQPDEDTLAELIKIVLARRMPGPRKVGVDWQSTNPSMGKVLSGFTKAGERFQRRLTNFVNDNLSDAEAESIGFDWYSCWSDEALEAAKRMMPQMPDDIKTRLATMGSNLASSKTIRPIGAWRVDERELDLFAHRAVGKLTNWQKACDFLDSIGTRYK